MAMAFLVFEGLDGSGKSTLISGLSSYLDKIQIKFELTREPGGTELGEEIRELLLRNYGDTPCPRTELLLYEAGRAQHVEKKIKPAIAEGKWVLCDRFTASTLAFQAGGRGIEAEPIIWLNEFATDGCSPQLSILLDLPIEESEKRMQKRNNEGQEKDRMESEKAEFHQRVRSYYLQVAKANEKDWLVLDARMKPEVMLSNLIDRLKERKCLPF